MGLKEFIQELKSKQSFIEGSHSNLPVTGAGETLSEVFDRYLDERNAKPLSNLDKQEIGVASILDAYAMAEDEHDIDTFLQVLVLDLFILSSSVQGERSKQLQNIAVGQMNRNFAMELAEIRSGEGGNKELKDAI